MVKPFEIYKDAKCTKKAETFEFDRTQIGMNITVEYFIKNNGIDTLFDFESLFKDKDLTFKFPKEIKPGKVEKFTVNWQPSGNRRNVLKESAHLIAKGKVG